MFGVTENNYLGRGVSLDAEVTVNKESIKVDLKLEIQILEIQINQFMDHYYLKRQID